MNILKPWAFWDVLGQKLWPWCRNHQRLLVERFWRPQLHQIEERGCSVMMCHDIHWYTMIYCVYLYNVSMNCHKMSHIFCIPHNYTTSSSTWPSSCQGAPQDFVNWVLDSRFRRCCKDTTNRPSEVCSNSGEALEGLELRYFEDVELAWLNTFMFFLCFVFEKYINNYKNIYFAFFLLNLETWEALISSTAYAGSTFSQPKKKRKRGKDKAASQRREMQARPAVEESLWICSSFAFLIFLQNQWTWGSLSMPSSD